MYRIMSRLPLNGPNTATLGAAALTLPVIVGISDGEPKRHTNANGETVENASVCRCFTLGFNEDRDCEAPRRV